MKSLISVLLLLFVMASCQTNNKKSEANEKTKASNVTLTAAGATFPMPFYNMVFKNYTEKNGILLTYGGIGSGGGIRSLTDKVVDFGATDAFLEDDKLAEMPAEVLHIPTCMGAVVIAYNLPGMDGLKLSDELLSKIFLGKITRWNDPELRSNNPGLTFPDKEITVVYRSDGSGTTHIFSDYMSKVSPAWAEAVGTGKSLNWPVGIGAKGNPGVAGTISATEGTIGYIGSEYAFTMKIQTASVKNSSGKYIEPTIESISAAAKGEMPADTRVMITNSSDPDAYPISGFTWIILYKEQAYNNRSFDQGRETLRFLDWLLSSEAQNVAAKVHYAPLPEKAVIQAKDILRSVTFEGKQIL
ncbi:MAG TPA: phosphate ABC transporter substrate-binding protein PstS [Prolixibacteraceae bacterium]|nr:phosphate ABC transporter substrate-binding protein PstS [Prolixibacteraceae bacterium]